MEPERPLARGLGRSRYESYRALLGPAARDPTSRILFFSSRVSVSREPRSFRPFEILTHAIKSGRRVFVNINKYINDTMVGNFGNFFALGLLYLLASGLPLLPRQVLPLGHLLSLSSPAPSEMAAVVVATLIYLVVSRRRQGHLLQAGVAHQRVSKPSRAPAMPKIRTQHQMSARD